MVTACTIVSAGRAEQARRVAASLAEHDPDITLSVLVLAREDQAAFDVRRERFLVVMPQDVWGDDNLDVFEQTRPAAELGPALAPAMLRLLLVQSECVVLLDRLALTGSLADVVDAARAAGVLADAEGRLIALARGAQATALLDAWDVTIAAGGDTAAPLPDDVAHLQTPPPWKPLPAGDATLDGPPSPNGRTPSGPPLGVNLVGYLRAELGVAEVARQLISAFDTQEVPLLPIAIDAGTSRQQHPFGAVERFAHPYAINLLCVNADQTPQVAAMAGPDFFAGRSTIGLWWWEVSDFPDFFRAAFDVVDEIWAGSAFVADTLRAVSPKPVVRIPMPVTLPADVAPARTRFGFAEDEVTFLYVFDYNSVVARKNPVGLVDAYRRAFPEAGAEDMQTRLVLKCINSERHPSAHAQVLAAIAGREDVTVMDDYLSAADKDALLASCDCYVSLHRSEGFGLTCAEAMLLGKPVIATGYSGTADFMDAGHSLPVGWTMVPVGPANEPYPADGEWADPDLDQAAAHMRAVAADPELRRTLGERARAFVQREHSPAAAGAAMRARLEVVAASTPTAPRRLAAPSLALEQVRATVDTGPAPGTGSRWHPRRLARATALRLTAPRARHQTAIDREIVAATQEAVMRSNAAVVAALQRAECDAWDATAITLREQRRLNARLQAVEHELTTRMERA
jgi:glycosyltransferase involved in cell wall biosynthesis